jgi:ribosome maturation protein SDO1
LFQICLIEPGAFRFVDEIIKKEGKGKGSVDMLSLSVQQEGEGKIE